MRKDCPSFGGIWGSKRERERGQVSPPLFSNIFARSEREKGVAFKKSPRLESTSCLFPPLCLSTLRLAQSVRIVQAGGNDGGGGGDRKEKDFVLKGVREIKFEFFVRVVMVGNDVV